MMIEVMAPGTHVKIIDFELHPACLNNEGWIVETKARRCCENTLPEGCVEYLVRYEFNSCNYCGFLETWFCHGQLEDLTP